MKKILLIGLMFLIASASAFAQSRVVTGTVSSTEDGMGIPGATIMVKGTTIGTATDIYGDFSLNVPSDESVLVFSFVGMIKQEIVVGNRSQILVELKTDINTLGEVIVSGLAAGTPEKKLSFSIGKLNEEIIQQVPAVSAAGALQGKIAGVRVIQSSRPGANATIQLRGATSITGSSEPLIVVDGVLTEGRLSDFNVQDIERMEVLKGASGASLYGSRAANGVVLIYTKRGSKNKVGETRVRVRNEFGMARAYNSRAPLKTTSHHFLTNADGSLQVGSDANGFGLGVNNPRGIQDGQFPGQLFNHIAEAFTGGEFMTNYVGVTHNSGKTTMLSSFEHTLNSGPVLLNTGNRRVNFRINLDHNISDRFKLTTSTLFARSNDDQNLFGGFGTRGAIRNLFMMDPSANLMENNVDGSPYKWNVNKFGNSEGNPLYTMSRLRRDVNVNRFVGNYGFNYEIMDGLTFEYAFGLDSRTTLDSRFLDKGHLDISAGDTPRLGNLSRDYFRTDALTSTATFVYVKKFGDFNFRSRAYYMYENNSTDNIQTSGRELSVSGIDRFQNAQVHNPISTFSSRITANNFAAIVGGDYKDKYIFDALIRREAVSLFGANERWQTFYRFSGNYRFSEDVKISGIQEWSFRGSYGTAGGRPGFSAQYEARPLSGLGIVGQGGVLGNANLRPNLTSELEVGMNLDFLNRFSLNAAYSQQSNRDQIIQVPVSAVTGWSAQWQNAGTLETNTFEFTLGYNAIKKAQTSLDFNLIFDRTRQNITSFDRPDQLVGFGLFREGLVMGNVFGQRHATSLSEVTNQVPAGQNVADVFQVNSDGYVIRAGTEFTPDERPTLVREDDGSLWQGEIGDMNSNFNMGLATTISHKGFQVYMLWDAQIGGQIYNRGAQWMARDFIHPMYDQRGKIEEDKKYMAYYQGFYNVAQSTQYWLEDATNVRLRELAINYGFSQSDLAKLGLGKVIKGAKISLIGRNLLLFSKYSGFDPEVGGFISRVDDFSYPLTRNYTASIEFTF